ncbi:MAG TPA: hypothetical protein VLA19_22090 [Herpetosiphonaceae bacterium]|nr:hypothetical protein [Herpetosiphonaceae bacterium]
MPRACSICVHDDRAAINKALIAGEPFRLIAERFGTSATALTRHKAEHLPAKLAKASAAKETAIADDLLAQVRALRNNAIRILTAAEESGDLRTALLGIREARACVELLAEMEGELNRTPQVNILIAPEWLTVRSLLMRTLTDYPEARAQVAAALMTVDHGNG